MNAPLDPANDPLGALAQRRVTDSYTAEAPVRELNARADAYTPGDTDLSWTRITPWRSMLAAALDQVVCDVQGVEVEGEEFNPSCELLAMWLADRLSVPVKRSLSSGPASPRSGCARAAARSCWTGDGSLATLSIHGQPDRAVALKRRETAELIAEELRRLDPDDTYASALRFGVDRLGNGAERTDATEPSGTEEAGASNAAPAQDAVRAPEPGAPEKDRSKKAAAK